MSKITELQDKFPSYRHDRVVLRGGIHLLYWFLEDEDGVEDEFVTTLTGKDASFFNLTEQEFVELYMQAKAQLQAAAAFV